MELTGKTVNRSTYWGPEDNTMVVKGERSGR